MGGLVFIEADGEQRSLEWLHEHAAEVGRINAYGRGITELPPILPAATYVKIGPCPKLPRLPELPVAAHVTILGCPLLPFNASRRSSRGNLFTAARVRGRWRICVGIKTFTVADCRVRWGEGTNNRAPGKPEPLELAEEVWAKVLAAHPEAASDDVVDDPFYVLPGFRPIYAAMREVEKITLDVVNLIRVFRGESPLPPREKGELWDAPEWPPRD